MLGNIFKKIIGSDPKSKVFKEFKNIIELNAKILQVEKEYGQNEDSNIQKDIITNNLLTLAKVFDGLETSQMVSNYDNTSTYFNIQGTETKVFVLEYFEEIYTHKETGTSTTIINDMEASKLKAEIISLEEKFRALKKSKFKKDAWTKLQKKIEDSVENKVEEFSKRFKGNEELVRDFILNNFLDGEIDYDAIIRRINFVHQLTNSPLFNLDDADHIDISNKDIVVINKQVFKIKEDMNIAKLLKDFNQKRYDFIVQI